MKVLVSQDESIHLSMTSKLFVETLVIKHSQADIPFKVEKRVK